MAYDRNARAREQGFRNYYEYRKASAQSRGFASARHITQTNKRLGEVEPGASNPFDLRSNPIWQSQVPADIQDDARLMRAFRKGFLEPIGIGAEPHKLSNTDKLERQFFLDEVPDFDWDMWGEYAEEEGESNPYTG